MPVDVFLASWPDDLPILEVDEDSFNNPFKN